MYQVSHIYDYYYHLWCKGLTFDHRGILIWKKGRHYGLLLGFDIGR